MRIGILGADELTTEIREQHGSYERMFRKLFLSVDKQLSFKEYSVSEFDTPQDIHECDAYLITGSKASANDKREWIDELKALVLNLHRHKKKLLGICFGHQLIALALGGEVAQNAAGWGVGVTSAVITAEKPWMQTAKSPFKLLLSHQDQVTRLPQGAELIAANEFCPVSSFQVGAHILTFQGHPEFSADFLRYILEKRRQRIGADRVQAALANLDDPVDDLLVGRWMLNFIQ